MVKQKSLRDVAERYGSLIKEIKKPLRNRWIEEAPSGGLILHKHDVRLFAFSDTLLLWTGPMRTKDNSHNRAHNLERSFAFFRSVTLLVGIGLSHGFPLRIGVAFGPTYADRQSQRFLGRAIINAYDVERSQDWIGVACHPSCDTNIAMKLHGHAPFLGPHVITLDDLLIKHAIPTKSGKIRRWTVDWPPFTREETYQILHDGSRKITDAKARLKWTNTLRFFESRQTYWSGQSLKDAGGD